MARLLGVEIPPHKKIGISLRYIYGIGPSNALAILAKAGVDPNVRTEKLSDEQLGKILSAIQQGGYVVEGDLRREVGLNLKRLIGIRSFRGSRHVKGLPVRGQRTRTNARTRKGPRKTVGVVRSKEAKTGIT